MTEIYDNIRDEVKTTAETAWNVASHMPDPVTAANLLNDITNYYSIIYNEEEVGFLRFYFNLQMEMMKE